MNFRLSYIYISLLLLSLIVLFSSFSNKEEKIFNDGGTSFPQEYKIVTPPIPTELEFCEEEVPLNNFEVYER